MMETLLKYHMDNKTLSIPVTSISGIAFLNTLR